jgi:hypothetical protein
MRFRLDMSRAKQLIRPFTKLRALLRKDWLSVRKEGVVVVWRGERARPNRPFGFDRSGARPGEGLGSS